MYVKVQKKDLGNVYYERISEQFVVDNDEYFFMSDDYCRQRNMLDVIAYCNHIKAIINNTPSKFGVVAMPEIFMESYNAVNDLLKSINKTNLIIMPEPKKVDIPSSKNEHCYCITQKSATIILSDFDEIIEHINSMMDEQLRDGLYAVYSQGKIYYCLASYISKSNPELKNKSFILVDDNETDIITFDYIGVEDYPSIGKKIWSVTDCINNIVTELLYKE